MRDVVIELTPFTFLSILSCKLEKKLNEHTYLYFEGRISKDQEEEVQDTNLKNAPVSLSVLDEDGQSKVLFCGVIKELSIGVVGESRVLKLVCISSTYFMDITRKTRVFQNKSSQYKAVLQYIGGYEDYGFIMSEGDGKTIKKLIVQYNETDFEFIKRLASHFNTSVCPAYLTQGVKYYFGIPKSANTFLLKGDYIFKKEIKEDLRKDEATLPFSVVQGNSIVEMKSREIYEIGDFTTIAAQSFVVCEIYSKLIGGEFMHTYILKEKMTQYCSKYYNSKLIGASLSASISAVSRDKVRVLVHESGIQDSVDWFAYSTVYSSPDGTGWYCMPEKGDGVRLHFPTEKEQHGYIISAVHVENETSRETGNSSEPPRSNPENKSLKSKYGKEVLFTPSSLIFTNNNGMTIEILDNDGISITSKKKVNINSDEEIDMVSTNQSINLNGTESIIFEQMDTKIEMKDTIKTAGAKVQLE